MAHSGLSGTLQKESAFGGKADIPRNVINCTSGWVRLPHSYDHQIRTALPRRTEAMTRQHHTSFAQSIIGSAQRMFRSAHSDSLLAPARIDARTARDIGVNLVGMR